MFKIFEFYGFYGTFRLIRDKLYTICFFSKARIVRLPLYIRGRKGIYGAENLTTGVNLRIDLINTKNKIATLYIGKNVQLNDYVHIAVSDEVSIGDNTLIASKVFISDHNHGLYTGSNQSNPNEYPINRILNSKKVVIGKNVWIGEYVCILPGVTIGDGAIIGAMSVVTKDIPKNSIAVGSPAIVIKEYDLINQIWVKI